jgi:hypothetical protein
MPSSPPHSRRQNVRHAPEITQTALAITAALSGSLKTTWLWATPNTGEMSMIWLAVDALTRDRA